jgi:hypothetical protein
MYPKANQDTKWVSLSEKGVHHPPIIIIIG